MADQDKNSELSELIKYLKANLLLQLRNLSENENATEKLEFLLYRAGFSRGEIADLLGKKYETVKKTIQALKPEKTDKDKVEDKDVVNEGEKNER